MNILCVFILFICHAALVIPAFQLDTLPEFVLAQNNITQVVTNSLNDTLIPYNHTSVGS